MAAPVVIGLSGGVASGKSTVARMFEELGASVLDADRIGHEVLEEDEIKSKIKQIWGEQLYSDGQVNRKSLAKIVFEPETGPEQLALLEAITHPAIKRRILEELAGLADKGCPAVVLDAPLLFKAGWDELCQKLVFVEADFSVRFKRAVQRGWSERELRERENRQIPLADKRGRSTDIICNSNGLEKTFSQVRRLWKSWGFPIRIEATDPT